MEAAQQERLVAMELAKQKNAKKVESLRQAEILARTIICPKCSGTGKITGDEFRLWVSWVSGQVSGEYIPPPCSLCGGSGRVVLKK